MTWKPHESTPAELAARLAADRTGVPYLLFRDGDGRQRILSLAERDRLTVGRLPGNDLVLAWDPQVSRSHAVLERVGPDWTVVDDGLSRNGTFLNELRVQTRQRLAHGDRLRVGDTLVAFHAGGPHVVETTAAVQTLGDVALTEAQRRVLVALCRPFTAAREFPVAASNREIAEALHLSVESVRTHLRALFERFEVPDLPQNAKRAELARRALRSGAVTRADYRSPP